MFNKFKTTKIAILALTAVTITSILAGCSSKGTSSDKSSNDAEAYVSSTTTTVTEPTTTTTVTTTEATTTTVKTTKKAKVTTTTKATKKAKVTTTTKATKKKEESKVNEYINDKGNPVVGGVEFGAPEQEGGGKQLPDDGKGLSGNKVGY